MNALEPTQGQVSERLRLALPRLGCQWRAETRLADLALDSLDLVELLCVVHQDFGVRLSEEELASVETVGGLVSLITRKAQTL